MEPKLFAQAIVSLEDKYGLRLDAQDVWLRLDDWKRLGPNQRGKPCGRVWVGLRGACKRGKKSDDNAEKIKASKMELADKIRAKKGLRDRNAPKTESKPKVTSNPTKEERIARAKARDAFRDRIYPLLDAPVTIAPPLGKALKMIEALDYGELAKYESRFTGEKSRRYTGGVEIAKKRINDLQDKISSLSEIASNQEQKIRKAQNSKANRAGRSTIKKRGKDNPYGLESDGIGSPWTKSAINIRELEKINKATTEEIEKLGTTRRRLLSSWGDRIAIKDRESSAAQESK